MEARAVQYPPRLENSRKGQRMTWGSHLDQFADRFNDRLNPLLVKEVRQALKGRLFLITFALLLLGAWCVSVFGVNSAGDAIYWQSSPWLLGAYVIVLQIAVLAFVPTMAFRSMQAETEFNTWELVCITTLSPRRLVAGKLGCAVVQTLLLCSVIAPCIAFCSLLPGFDWMLTAIVLGVTLVFSLLNTIFSLMLSSLATNRLWQNLALGALWLVLAGEVRCGYELVQTLVTGQDLSHFVNWLFDAISLGYGSYYYSGTMSLSPLSFWFVEFTLAMLALAYFFLFYEITVSQVTFEADSRSGRIRLLCSLLYVLQWGLLVICDDGGHYRANPALGLFIVHWLVFGLSACLESETISTRIRRRLSGWSRLRSPYLPGGSRALVFMLLHLGSTPLIAFVVGTYFRNFRSGPQIALWSMYLLTYITIAVACCRSLLAMNPTIRRANLRLGVAIGIVLSMLPSFVLAEMFYNVASHFFLLTIFNPFAYSALNRQSWTMVTPLALVALIGVHLNWEIIKRSVLDVSSIGSEIQS